MAENKNWVGPFTGDFQSVVHRIQLEVNTFFEIPVRLLEGLSEEDKIIRKEILTALISLRYVNTMVSSALYMWAPDEVKYATNAQDILNNGAGICGHHVEVYMAIMDHFGIKSRMIQFSNRSREDIIGHVACEVQIDNKWRYIDVSFNSVISSTKSSYDLIGIQDYLSAPEAAYILRNENDPYIQYYVERFGDPIKTLVDAEHFEILINGSGAIMVPFKNNFADFSAIPNFAGSHLRSLGRSGNVKLLFHVPAGYSLELTFGGASYFAGFEGTLQIKDATKRHFEAKVANDIGKILLTDIDEIIEISVLAENYSTILIQEAKLIEN